MMETGLLRFNAMSQPSSRDLPDELHAAAVFIAQRLNEAGHQAWIVGGALRDLVLGEASSDIDMATDARPESVEQLFEHTSAVGKAFGTIVVHLGPAQLAPLDAQAKHKLDIELTTFRSDGQYIGNRRPEEVTYGSSVEEDARRRDFTCNALYLDPLSEEFLDPEQGLVDLAAGRLRCVGDPLERFTEDGLRLMRMARFAARLDCSPTPETLQAARACATSLAGISRERVLKELLGIFETPRPGVALRLLDETGLLQVALGGEQPLQDHGSKPEACTRQRLAAFDSLGGPLDPVLGLALLLGPEPLSVTENVEAATHRLESLKPSRAMRSAVLATWRLIAGLSEALEQEPARSTRWRWLRDAHWPQAFAALRAWLLASDVPGTQWLERLERERATLSTPELNPPALLTSTDLSATSIPRGPLWGRLLTEAETLQLDLELTNRTAALAWLEQRAQELGT